MVNLACAYGQKYKWLEKNNSGEDLKQATREKALEYIRKTLDFDKKGGWLYRLQTLLRTDIIKKATDRDLEVFENDDEFRRLLELPPVVEEIKIEEPEKQ